jgi:glycerol dehydrogenase
MLPGNKMAIFPRRYLQGVGAINFSGKLSKIYMKKAFIVGGKRAIESAKRAGFFESLNKAELSYVVEHFGHEPYGPESCEIEIDRLTKIAVDNGCDGVIAIGGGKAIDTGKAVAHKLNGEVVIIPTIAANDAPTSALSVIYTPEHVFKEYWFYDVNPAMVLVDSKIIADAPARYLAGGMGDAATKKFEAEACVRSGSKNLAVMPEWIAASTDFSLTIARNQYDRLLEYGELAMDAVRVHSVTPALEAIIETNILWSGIAFESSGLSAAHAIHDGFTIAENLIPEEYRPIHGELTNFGALIEMIIEDYSKDFIVNHMKWSHSVGLPITLSELGFKEEQISDELLWKIAEKSVALGETMHTEFFTTQGAKEIGPYKNIVNPAELVFYSIKHLNALGKRIKEIYPRVPYSDNWIPYDAFIKKK